MTYQDKWPLWARIASRFRVEGDRGVGDTIEHWQGIMGSGQFKVWHLAVFRTLKHCPSCPLRWNRQFPYTDLAMGLLKPQSDDVWEANP